MKDVVVLALTMAFFALGVAYVALCDRIIGPDEPQAEQPGGGDAAVADDGAPPVAAGVTR